MGVFADGEQLPSETDLASQLQVSTVTLREALAGLRRTGLVYTRRGRNGGTFVRAPMEEAAGRLMARLAELSIDDLRDFGDYQAAISTGAAGLAAERASIQDIARLEDHVARLAAATTVAEQRAADARFHIELTASSRSLRLTRAEMDIHADLGPLTWLAIDKDGAARAVDDHRRITAALRARDAELAKALAEQHVRSQMEDVIALRLSLAARGRRKLTPESCARGVLKSLRGALDEVYGDLAVLRAQVEKLEAAARADGRKLQRSDLGPMRALAREHLAQRELISGTGMIFAPGVLADAPLWLEWWHEAGGREPVPLDASLTPGDPDFYDYENAEWFTTPRDTGSPWIAGPFVDHSGTNEHIFTVSVPVAPNGEFLGVVGADVAVEQIERLAQEKLVCADGDALLVTSRGRIVASNSPSHLVGTRWSLLAEAAGEDPDTLAAQLPPGSVVLRDDTLMWSVVVSPSS